ncbi:MAG: two-component sensor histidine kinase, two-component system, OmpR family, sensor histidine kinase VicK [Candidatus Wolfebacteria bacterium GW2011_GWC1_43_10]|uniref:histidine kinase n=2 Tax=Candidatus Wolfeibacteriota TaxID=1752735 RepID=A0A0G1EIB7_9BACT|nr:MAG: two-component sensor histidine kinase, two-component system, OmpR family, sensor histidine kinase VicK [Candidatus Wolfebacteria bacterium GW2011_GWC1_43_10]KKT23153.1 MAG: Signal transduction histidine kinase [Parcubacteria group bacterium GW2011_GWB1_43_8b]OGM89269.1 MAG: hypothetical protein A2108_00130 [Candidatus Wolfebacteria bacterium GWA1_42_9]
MNKENPHSSKLTKYLNQPEFRPVFYLVPLIAAAAVINVIYLSGIWLFVSTGILIISGALMVAISWVLAKANLNIKIKTLQMDSIISHLPSGVLAYDNDFNVLIFNPAAQEIFGLSQSEIFARKLSAEMASDPKFKLLAQVIFPSLAPTVVKRSEPGTYPQIVDISFSDPSLDLRVVTDRVADETGKITGFVKLITNRTREMELLKSKTEFITVAAHQLRTPLTAINWSFESLESANLPPQQKELVDTGFMAAKKMLKTVNDLLDVSKIEEGKFGYQFEEVNLVSYLEEILAQSNDFAKQLGIKLYFQRPANSNLMVFMDKQKVSMVLSNLLDNAIKYNVENGEVTVSVEEEKDEPFIRVSVKDTGIGIPADQIDKLFTKFFRAENVARYSPDGTGMGLYIARNVVVRHGGRIWAESELNRGTTFYFTLPTKQEVIPKREMIEFE